MPPLWLAGTRFTIAGLLLLLIARFLGGWRRLTWSDVGRLAIMAAGAISICFGLIFWGEQYVDSNVAAVVVQGFVPLGLCVFAALYGHEAIRPRQWMGIAVGLAGVVLLTLSQASLTDSNRTVVGIMAIVVGTLVYDWAGVYGKPIFERYPAPFISALENLIGGLILLPIALLVDYERIIASPLPPSATAMASWAYLVVIGSLVGFTAYTYLLGAWGASRTSAYAFATPAVALALGVWIGKEQVQWSQLVGAGLVISAVALMLKPVRASPIKVVHPVQPQHQADAGHSQAR
jgi:drug/metabolite transporter (DMT)-like permease